MAWRPMAKRAANVTSAIGAKCSWKVVVENWNRRNQWRQWPTKTTRLVTAWQWAATIKPMYRMNEDQRPAMNQAAGNRPKPDQRPK